MISHYFLPVSVPLPYTMHREYMKKDSDTAVLLSQTEKIERKSLFILSIPIITLTRCQSKGNMAVIHGHSQ